MKIDLYTKLVLTVIAVGIGMLVFEQKPVREAQAGIMGGGGMISPFLYPDKMVKYAGTFHLRDGKIRWCSLTGGTVECREWVD